MLPCSSLYRGSPRGSHILHVPFNSKLPRLRFFQEWKSLAVACHLDHTIQGQSHNMILEDDHRKLHWNVERSRILLFVVWSGFVIHR